MLSFECSYSFLPTLIIVNYTIYLKLDVNFYVDSAVSVEKVTYFFTNYCYDTWDNILEKRIMMDYDVDEISKTIFKEIIKIRNEIASILYLDGPANPKINELSDKIDALLEQYRRYSNWDHVIW